MDNERHITQTIIDVHDYQQPEVNYQMQIVKPELDLNYLKTLSGMLKCICITLDFVCFICLVVGGPAIYRGVGWMIFICIIAMLVSLVLLIFYLFHIVDILHQIPWIVSEMVFYFAWAVLFLICGCVLTLIGTRFHSITGYSIAAFFSFGALCAYGFDSYLKFLAWRHDEVATGGRTLKYLPHADIMVLSEANHAIEVVES
ncbi:Plasmolipin [Dirofilaria immitis]